jgi:hypothetical protein
MAPAYPNNGNYDDESFVVREKETLGDDHRISGVNFSPPGNNVAMSRSDQKTISRTNSINYMGRPAKVEPSAKIPGEFRTLRLVRLLISIRNDRDLCWLHSIHVTDTKEGRTDPGGQKDITGAVH